MVDRIILREGEIFKTTGEIITREQESRAEEKRLVQKMRESGRAPVRRTQIILGADDKQVGVIKYRGAREQIIDGKRVAKPLGQETEAEIQLKGRPTQIVRGIPEFVEQEVSKFQESRIKPYQKITPRTDIQAGIKREEQRRAKEEADKYLSEIQKSLREQREEERRLKNKLKDKSLTGIILNQPIESALNPMIRKPRVNEISYIMTGEKLSKYQKLKRKILGKIQRGELGSGLQLTEGQLQSATALQIDKKGNIVRDKKGNYIPVKVTTPQGDAIRLAIKLGASAGAGLATKEAFGILATKIPKFVLATEIIGGALYTSTVPKRIISSAKSGAKGVIMEFSGDAGFIAGTQIPTNTQQKFALKEIKKVITNAPNKKSPSTKQITNALRDLSPRQQDKFIQNLIKAYPTTQKGKVSAVANRLIQAQQKIQRNRIKDFYIIKDSKVLDVDYKKIAIKKPTIFDQVFNRKSNIKDIVVNYNELKTFNIKGIKIAKGKEGLALLRFKKGKLIQITPLSANAKTVSELPKGISPEGLAIIQKPKTIISKSKLKIGDLKTGRYFKPLEKAIKIRSKTEKPKLESFKEFLMRRKLEKTTSRAMKPFKKPEITIKQNIKIENVKAKMEAKSILKKPVQTVTQTKTLTKPTIDIYSQYPSYVPPVVIPVNKLMTEQIQKLDLTPKQKEKIEQYQEMSQKELLNIKPIDQLKLNIDQIQKPIIIPIQRPKIDQIQKQIEENIQRLEQKPDLSIEPIQIITGGGVYKFPSIFLPPLPPKKMKRLLYGIQEQLNRIPKRKQRLFLEYTPTLGGLGQRATRTTGAFSGFEVRGNIIKLKPVEVIRHKRSNLKYKLFVRRYRRRKPRIR